MSADEPQFISPWYRRCDNPQCRFNYVYEAEQGQPHYHYLGAGLPVEPD